MKSYIKELASEYQSVLESGQLTEDEEAQVLQEAIYWAERAEEDWTLSEHDSEWYGAA